ncbi:MFS transporter [Listeria fleischmannii]|nr:MFS transporter [Listeria fleischmannii]
MVLGSVLNPINSSMIAVALVPIAVAFGVGSSETAWLVSALYFATAIGQPVVGKLIDSYGPRKLFLIGTVLVGVAGVIALLTPVFWLLVVARIILGLGTTAGYPAAMYLIKSEGKRTGEDNPAWILTLLVISSQTVAVIGPTLGGFLIHLGGFRLVFSINIPLAIIAFLAGYFVLPKEHTKTQVSKMDWVGVFYFSIATFSLLFFLMNPHITYISFLVLTIIVGFLFVRRENAMKDPFINLEVLRGNRPLIRTYIRILLAATVQYSFMYGFAQWLEIGRGLNEVSAGMLMMPTFISSIIVSALSGRNSKYFMKTFVGGIVQFLSISLLLLTTNTSSIIYLIIVAAGFGITTGLLNLANQNVLYFQADPKTIGASSGLLRTFSYFGAMLAGAFSGAFMEHQNPTFGFHQMAFLNLCLALIFIGITWYDRHNLQKLKGSIKNDRFNKETIR